MKIFQIEVGRESYLYTSEATVEQVRAAVRWFNDNQPDDFSYTDDRFTVGQWRSLCRWLTGLGLEGWEEGDDEPDDNYLDVWEPYHAAEALQQVIALRTGVPFTEYRPIHLSTMSYYYDSSWE